MQIQNLDLFIIQHKKILTLFSLELDRIIHKHGVFCMLVGMVCCVNLFIFVYRILYCHFLISFFN